MSASKLADHPARPGPAERHSSRRFTSVPAPGPPPRTDRAGITRHRQVEMAWRCRARARALQAATRKKKRHSPERSQDPAKTSPFPPARPGSPARRATSAPINQPGRRLAQAVRPGWSKQDRRAGRSRFAQEPRKRPSQVLVHPVCREERHAAAPGSVIGPIGRGHSGRGTRRRRGTRASQVRASRGYRRAGHHQLGSAFARQRRS